MLPRRKNLAQVVRGRISTRARAWLLDAEGYRCARCERERPWPAGNLVIDHIVPVSLRGVDEPANWVALCRAHNRAKWQWFDPDYIRRYHGERVRRRVQVRFRHGFFWPVINGQLRTETRDAVKTMPRPGAAR